MFHVWEGSQDGDRLADMSWPAICRNCRHLHDAGKVESAGRYTDCSMWRCPQCDSLLDDRPSDWGGSIVGHKAVREALGVGVFWMM